MTHTLLLGSPPLILFTLKGFNWILRQDNEEAAPQKVSFLLTETLTFGSVPGLEYA